MKAKMAWIALAATVIGWVSPVTEAASEAVMPPSTQAVITEPASEASVEPEGSDEPTKEPEGSREPSAEASAEPTPTPTPEPTSAPEPEICTTTIAAGDIKNHTSHEVDTDALRAEGASLTLPSEGTQILIVHTHTCEAYTPADGAEYEPSGDWRTLDEEHNTVAVGEALKTALESYGLRVLHDTTVHDWPSYNSAYVRSAETVESYLAQEPDIALVIDLHRDAIGDDERIYKTVTDTAEPMAQLMLVVGSDENLPHPGWQENLKLALTLQQAALESCSTLMRPINLSSCRYNQQLAPGALILEAGTCGNTLAEAVAAVECFAEAVGPLLAERVEAAQ